MRTIIKFNDTLAVKYFVSTKIFNWTFTYMVEETNFILLRKYYFLQIYGL